MFIATLPSCVKFRYSNTNEQVFEWFYITHVFKCVSVCASVCVDVCMNVCVCVHAIVFCVKKKAYDTC